MDTSGTGHDRCPSPCPGPSGARTPPFGGDKKISKVVFGFKRGTEKFLEPIYGRLAGQGFVNKSRIGEPAWSEFKRGRPSRGAGGQTAAWQVSADARQVAVVVGRK